MDPELLKLHTQTLSRLLQSLVTDRYKRMAKDEVLSRFVSSTVDPVLLVDRNLQVEREAVQISEMSLLKLVSSEQMKKELQKLVSSIQRSFQEIYQEGVVEDFLASALFEARLKSLDARTSFYRYFLTVSERVQDPLKLAQKGFSRAEVFQKKLEPIFEADHHLHNEMVRQTQSMHRFLMRKQLDYELLKSKEVWLEFKTEAFKTPQALP